MKMKLLKKILACALLVVSLAMAISGCTFDIKDAGSMVSGSMNEYSESFDLQGKYAEVRTELDMIGARASIEKSDEKLVEGSFKYSGEELKPEFRVKGNSIEIKNNGSHNSLIKPVNHWSVKLTDKVPVDFGITSEASEGRFDLSGIAVKKLELGANASNIKLYMDTPNACQLKRFNMDTNAGEYELTGLGNLNFSRIDIDAKASKYAIDLNGEYKKDGVLRLKADASTVKLKVPDNVGVRLIIEKSNISTLIVDNSNILKHSDEEYQSGNYEKADIKLTVYLDMNITTINIL